MSTLRAHIVLPTDLVQQIDELVGPRGRSAFLVEIAAKEIKRRKLLAFLQGEGFIWQDQDHPDIVERGTAEWVRELRNEPSTRLKDRDENFDPL